jgi:hypothetical protein
MNFKFKPDTLFIVLAGAIALFYLRFSTAPAMMASAMPVAPSDSDMWTTPYYLRYNVPSPMTSMSLLPIPANYTYALGVPSAPYTQRAVTGGG